MTIVQELEQKKTELIAANAKIQEVTVSIETVKGEAQKQVSDMQAKIDETSKLVEAVSDERDGLKASLEASNAKIAEVQAELEKAQAALANPAFATAAVKGDKVPVAEGGSEAMAKMSKQEALAVYKKITDAKERAEYRKAHKEELGL